MSNRDYQSLNSELDTVLEKLQSPTVQVDEAVKLYEKGLKLVTELEQKMQAAESTIERLQVSLTPKEA